MKKYLVILALLGGFNQAASANLIVNGSFEDYIVPVNSTFQVAIDCTNLSNCITLNDTASPNLDPWQPINASPNAFLELRNGPLINTGTIDNPEVHAAPDGNIYAEVNFESVNGSGFQQTFTALEGTGNLSWWDHARGGEDINDYKIFLNYKEIYDSASFVDVYNWQERSILGVDLLGGNNVLQFVHDLPTHKHVTYNIDNVVLTQVSAVPEPETYAMFLAGLGLVGFANRKKAQK